ncbi:unnamed protein product [Diatraea saccharalis]|uniref:FP protein C-terminal domain-containing protein n=1 Tax=Diatraea saccharalis TaxID=40085 RepID=A0A9N9WEQ2_9NEOP|nr:unnamed protein product [Diatraea saccharalis]
MSVRRSPTKEASSSAPDLSKIKDAHIGNSASKENVASRHDKRKRGDIIEEDLKPIMDEMRKMMSLNREYQDKKFETLYSAMNDIKQQNLEISESLEFMSKKYEDLKQQLEKSEHERKKNLAYITELESRMSILERCGRNTSIEIRNLPQKNPETKEDLIKVVSSIGAVLSFGIETSDIKDIFRLVSKSLSLKPIIVEFTTVLKKEAFLNSAREFRKSKRMNLNTTHLKLQGPSEIIYMSESLTTNTKRLYGKARKFASENNYQYCWTKHGQIFLRKENGSKVTKIIKEEDLNALSTN